MIFLLSSTRRQASIAILALVMIALHLVLKYGFVIADEPRRARHLAKANPSMFSWAMIPSKGDK
jgi:hypothetical protein